LLAENLELINDKIVQDLIPVLLHV